MRVQSSFRIGVIAQEPVMQAEMTVFESVIDGFDDAVEHLKARHASASRPDAGPGRVICGASRIRTMSPTAWRT